MCEKCGDRGFTEREHGLVQVACDCEKGKALSAEITGRSTEREESLSDIVAEANAVAFSLMPRLEGEKQNDSNSGTGQPGSITRSTNPGKSQQPKKRKAKKRAAKKSS